MNKSNYYEILQIQPDATETQITKAYRRLAMKLHPDRNPGNKNAEANFKDAKEAAEVLTDARKRAAYDQYSDSERERFDPRTGGLKRAAPAAASPTQKGTRQGGNAFNDIYDILRSYNIGAQGTPPRPEPPKDPKLELISFPKSRIQSSVDTAIEAHQVPLDSLEKQIKTSQALVDKFPYGQLPRQENHTVVHLTPFEKRMLGVKTNTIGLSELDALKPSPAQTVVQVGRGYNTTGGLINQVLNDPLHPLKGITALVLSINTKRHDTSPYEEVKSEFGKAQAARKGIGSLREQARLLNDGLNTLNDFKETLDSNPSEHLILRRCEHEQLRSSLDKMRKEPGTGMTSLSEGSITRYAGNLTKEGQERFYVHEYKHQTKGSGASPNTSQQAPSQKSSHSNAGSTDTKTTKRQQVNRTLTL